MFTTARILSLVLATALATAAPAQDQPAEGEGTFDGDLALGEKAEPQVGDTYTAARHGDWRINCVKQAEGNDPCQMYQLLTDGEGNAVAEMTVFDVPNQAQAVAGSTIITPLGTLLTAQLTLSIDGEEGKRYPFSWCIQSGCGTRFAAAREGGRSDHPGRAGARSADQHPRLAHRFLGRVPRPSGPLARVIRARSRAHTARRASTALSPPKAKELLSTASTFASRASLGTTSSAHSGSGSS